METEILLCEYSYHTQKKRFNWRNGLNDYYFIRLQTVGCCHGLVDGEMKNILPGDLLMYPPGESCDLLIDRYKDVSGKTTISSGDYYIMCKGTWIDQWWQRSNRPTKQKVNNEDKLLVFWKEIIFEKRRIYEKDVELLDYLLRSLCLSIDKATNSASANRKQSSFDALAMKNYIEEHANQLFKIEDVASYVGFSVSRASHLFKETFGKTMMQYTLEIRLNTAVELVKYSEMTLEQVAEASGLGSYTYFHRVFREKYGMAPTKYFSNRK